MVVALHTPVVMVPTAVRLGKDVNVLFVVAVIFPAVMAVAALPVVFWFNVGISAASNDLKVGVAAAPEMGPAYIWFIALVPANPSSVGVGIFKTCALSKEAVPDVPL